MLRRLIHSVWGETTYKLSKEAPVNVFLSSLYVTSTTSFDKCFLFREITRGHFLDKLEVYCYSEDFQQPFCSFPWNKCFERSPYFQSSRIKLSYISLVKFVGCIKLSLFLSLVTKKKHKKISSSFMHFSCTKPAPVFGSHCSFFSRDSSKK